MRLNILRNRVRLKLVYSWLLECCFFLEIGVTRAIFSLSEKTPFAKEILKYVSE